MQCQRLVLCGEIKTIALLLLLLLRFTGRNFVITATTTHGKWIEWDASRTFFGTGPHPEIAMQIFQDKSRAAK